MAKCVGKKRNGVDKLVSEIRRTNSLDWREFNFFKTGVGLARDDQLSIHVCLDYELGRESPQVLENNTYLQKELQQSSEKWGRYIWLIPEGKKRFLHPLVCIATPWFPSPWLSACVEDRKKSSRRLKHCTRTNQQRHGTGNGFLSGARR